MPFCTECGAVNPRENKFCSECGSPLPVIEAPEPPADAVFPEAEAAPAEEPVVVEPAPQQPTYAQPQPAAYTPPASSQAAPFNAQAQQPVAPIPTGGLLAWSIVSILLCTIPGIVALVQTLGINKCLTAEEQEKKAKNARIWCIVATALGVLAIIVRLASGS